jgi:non-heme chloroperoxidase
MPYSLSITPREQQPRQPQPSGRPKDHTVPHSIAHASYKKQTRNQGVTEFVEMPNRGHALTIDSGWRGVADTALEFVRRVA